MHISAFCITPFLTVNSSKFNLEEDGNMNFMRLFIAIPGQTCLTKLEKVFSHSAPWLCGAQLKRLNSFLESNPVQLTPFSKRIAKRSEDLSSRIVN